LRGNTGLITRQHFQLDERDLQEIFIKGHGPGGQSVNKTSNCVLLKHIPTGTQVKCHDTRFLQENRRIARKRLSENLDELVNGFEGSARQIQIEKKRKRKAKQRYRSKVKQERLADEKESGTSTQGDDST